MNEKKSFYTLLKSVEKQLWQEHLFRHIQLLLMVSGIFSFLLYMIGRFVVIPYIERFLLVGIIMILVGTGYLFFFKRPRKVQSAEIYDQFVEDDRVKTALSFIEQDGDMYHLQRSDAILQMKKHQTQVLKRKKKWIHLPYIILAVLIWGGTIASILIPNETMKMADQKENEIKLVKKTEKKIDNLLKKEKNKTAKKELEKTKQELKSVEKSEEALKKLVKQTNQLELKQLKAKKNEQRLNQFNNQLKSTGLNELAKALEQKDMKKIDEQLNKLKSNWNQLSKQQKQALGQLQNNGDPLTKQQLAQLEKQIKEAIEALNQLQGLQLAENTITNTALGLQKDMQNEGLTPSTQVALSPEGNNANTTPQNQNSNQAGQNKGTGQPNGSGAKSGQGSSQGQGTGSQGQGNGSGNGQGQGSGSRTGQGTGNGKGLGSGAGLGQGSREFLTIPEKVDGKTNVEKDSGKLGSGQSNEQYPGDGPILKGSIRPYEEVFREYEKAYRNSTDRVQLPSDLEEIVKEYFSNLNPD